MSPSVCPLLLGGGRRPWHFWKICSEHVFDRTSEVHPDLIIPCPSRHMPPTPAGVNSAASAAAQGVGWRTSANVEDDHLMGHKGFAMHWSHRVLLGVCKVIDNYLELLETLSKVSSESGKTPGSGIMGLKPHPLRAEVAKPN